MKFRIILMGTIKLIITKYVTFCVYLYGFKKKIILPNCLKI